MLGELLEILGNTKQHASRYGIICLRGHDPHPLGAFEPVLGSVDKGYQGHGAASMLDGGRDAVCVASFELSPSQLE
jgi:hypothetical protein